MSDHPVYIRQVDDDVSSINSGQSTSQYGCTRPVQITADCSAFKSLKVHYVNGVQYILCVLLEIVAFVLPSHLKNSQYVTPYSALIYGHSIFWALIFVCGVVCKQLHNPVRSRGYFDLYQKTKLLRNLPLIVASVASVVIAVASAVLNDVSSNNNNNNNNNDTSTESSSLTDVNYLQILLTLEVCAVIICVTMFLVIMFKFNRAQPYPDVVHMSVSCKKLTIKDSCGHPYDYNPEELVYKHEDLIYYLNKQNSMLLKEVHNLRAEIGRM